MNFFKGHEVGVIVLEVFVHVVLFIYRIGGGVKKDDMNGG